MSDAAGFIPDNFNITYQETAERLEMKPHYHNFYEVIHVIEGCITFKVNNKIYTAGKDSLIFVSNLEAHELKVVGYPYKRYFILVKPDYFQSVVSDPVLVSIFKHRPSHFNHVISLDKKDSTYVKGLIESMYMEASDDKPFRETIIRSLLCLFFAHLFRGYSGAFPINVLNSSMETILSIQRYIEENYTEEVSLGEVAKMYYTDMCYLSHLFRRVTGFSFKEYLILQRISKAKDLLFYTSDDITQVGIKSGFNNVNHFIRVFKKFEGVTPLQYRKKFRE